MSRRNAKVNPKYNAKVKKLEDEFRRLYDNIPIPMWRANISDGRLTRANQFCAQILGFHSVAELERQSWELPNSSGYDGFVTTIRKDKSVNNYEMPYTRRDGSELVLSLTAKLSDEGYIEGSITDITAARRSAARLEEQQQKEIESLRRIKSQINDRLASGT